MSADTPPTLIDGRYEVVSELGHGGMGVVYLARDVGLDRLVAVKVMRSDTDFDLGRQTKAFQREARLLASLRDPHLAAVHSFGRHEDRCYFVMEHVEGSSLETIIREHLVRRATVPVHRAALIFCQVAGGLAAAHAAGIVHHDVKPANVVIEGDSGRPVLIDFGLATSGPYTQDDLHGGTPTYLAPEELERKYDRSLWSPRSDVYSFGCMMFELLSGKPPFHAAESVDELLEMHRNAPVPALAATAPELAPFDAVILRAMAKDRRARFPSALSLAAALEMATLEWTRATDQRGTVPPAPERFDSESPSGAGILAAAGQPRILVVDDDPDFLRFATRAVQLAFFGAKVDISMASDGARAVASAGRAPPHLVLLDFDMPGTDGLATLTQLRKLPFGAAIRVIVVSGRATEDTRWKFSVMGVRNFLHKPVQLEELVLRVREISERSGWVAPRETPAG